MAKRTNWWLEGWQYESSLGANGKPQKKLVYTGEYYDFPVAGKGLRRLKAAMCGLCLVALCAYILSFTLFQSGAARIFVGACMLSVIPLMYLLIGTGCLIPVKFRLTYREYRGSVVRIRWTGISLAVLEGVGVLGELLHLLSGPEILSTELMWLSATVLCCMCGLGLAWLEHRFRPRLVPPELK